MYNITQKLIRMIKWVVMQRFPGVTDFMFDMGYRDLSVENSSHLLGKVAYIVRDGVSAWKNIVNCQP